jgi:hypothetical protein
VALDRRLSRRFDEGADIPDGYWRLSRRWYVFGSIATVRPLANIFVMG